MTTITLRYDESNQMVLDALGHLISSGLATVDETIPKGTSCLHRIEIDNSPTERAVDDKLTRCGRRGNCGCPMPNFTTSKHD